MHKNTLWFFGLMACGWILSASPGVADGAVAIGLPDNVAKQGVAQGYSYNAKTPDDARRVAMGYCEDVTKSSKQAVALCKVGKIFHEQCVSFTLDPKPGTPGYGWGVGDDKDGAEKSAMAMCLDTAGASRQQYCKVVASDCDRAAAQ
jgi:hypothetical protein